MNDPIPHQPNCRDGDDQALPFEAARALIEREVTALAGRQVLALRGALGRVLERPLTSPAEVPPHRNSAMDGYALAAADLPAHGTRELQVLGTAWAGRPYGGPLQPGQCVRIMTGAKLPEQADSVVMQEQVQVLEGERIRIGGGHRAGQNVRHPGEDIARGQLLLPAGKRLGPAELGLLASLGIAEVPVHRRARVAFFSSGDELRSIGQPLGDGDIYDSNRYTLYGMLAELGADILDLGVVPDRPEALEAALGGAARDADLVLTTGGISVGAADHLQRLIRERGRVLFSKVNIKPGRPVTFGQWGDAWYFGLPGNPVAAMATFYQFVRPALLRLQGQPASPAPRFTAVCDERLSKNPGRTEIQRGISYRGSAGELRVRSTGRQGSGVLSSMSLADCFILLDEARGPVSPGDPVTIEPFGLLRH